MLSDFTASTEVAMFDRWMKGGTFVDDGRRRHCPCHPTATSAIDGKAGKQKA